MSMKVQAEPVKEFLGKLKGLIDSIIETVRIGDDGMIDNIQDQADNIYKAIDLFQVQNLEEVTPIEEAEKKYSRIVDNLYNKSDKSSSEIAAFYQAELYFFLKREIAKIDLTGIKNAELQMHIECAASGTKWEKLIYSKEWYYTSWHVICELAEEIIDKRAKAPQQKLF